GQDQATLSSNRLVLDPVDFYQAGLWQVEVRNAVGAAVSSNATLLVVQRPFFNVEPFGRQLLVGMDSTLSSFVDGTAPIFLQWKRNGAAIPGETNASLLLRSVQV